MTVYWAHCQDQKGWCTEVVWAALSTTAIYRAQAGYHQVVQSPLLPSPLPCESLSFSFTHRVVSGTFHRHFQPWTTREGHFVKSVPSLFCQVTTWKQPQLSAYWITVVPRKPWEAGSILSNSTWEQSFGMNTMSLPQSPWLGCQAEAWYQTASLWIPGLGRIYCTGVELLQAGQCWCASACFQKWSSVLVHGAPFILSLLFLLTFHLPVCKSQSGPLSFTNITTVFISPWCSCEAPFCFLCHPGSHMSLVLSPQVTPGSATLSCFSCFDDLDGFEDS